MRYKLYNKEGKKIASFRKIENLLELIGITMTQYKTIKGNDDTIIINNNKYIIIDDFVLLDYLFNI